MNNYIDIRSTMTRMMKFHRKIHGPLQGAACLSTLLLALLLTACSPQDAPDDVAAGKLSREEIQAANFLPLNDDKPGTFVTVQRYLVPGKYTIVHYFSPYDTESAYILPRLAQLTQVRQDIAVRTVNVNRPEAQGIDWQSPILQNAPIQKLPYFQIYDPRQSLRAQARPAYEQVIQWVGTPGR
jgi:hypothetical protein